MATQRKITFLNNSYYHIFNRGIDRRPTFISKKEYNRAMELLYFYQFASIPIRFSKFSVLPIHKQQIYIDKMIESGKIVEIVAYCLMPNHFHLLIKQKKDNGISIFTSNIVNAYTKYFNTKHERTGPLFQGIFKAVYVETDEQLLHLTRYIHLNPVTSSLIKLDELKAYPWSSYPLYILQDNNDSIVDKKEVSQILSAVPKYEEFVEDQVLYAKQLDEIKHLVLE